MNEPYVVSKSRQFGEYARICHYIPIADGQQHDYLDEQDVDAKLINVNAGVLLLARIPCRHRVLNVSEYRRLYNRALQVSIGTEIVKRKSLMMNTFDGTVRMCSRSRP